MSSIPSPDRSIPRPDPDVERAREASKSIYRKILDVFLTGIVVILPLVITIYILSAAFNIIVGILNPIIRLMSHFGLLESIKRNVVVQTLVDAGVYVDAAQFVEEITAIVFLLMIIIVIGVVASSRYGDRILDLIDRFLASIPLVGSIYSSFRRMGDAMLDSEAQNFRAVKLVEFPRDGTYVIGFETANSPSSIRRSAGSPDMTTLFLPLAPNPVMGGFLAHIPDDRILDVDMTVEEGVQSIITSGVAVSGGQDLTAEELRAMGVSESDIEERTELADGETTDAGEDSARTNAEGAGDADAPTEESD